MTDQKIQTIICRVCERRGPGYIYFRAEYINPDGDVTPGECSKMLVRITAVCDGCKNSEVVVESKPIEEVNAMSEAGQQLDLTHLKDFIVC